MSRLRNMPNAENCTRAELDVAIKAAPTRPAQNRLQAIKALIMGFGFAGVGELYNMSERTLRTWVVAFNLQGIDGLLDKPRPGRPRAIGAEHTERLRDLIVRPSQAEITHWTAKKFHGYLNETLQLEVGYSTLVRWMHEQNFRLKVPQPWPDRQDEALRAAWLAALQGLLADDDVELWYMDEMGVEGDPRPRRRWAAVGEKTRVTRNGDHLRMNVTGMLCPRTAQAFLLEFSHNDREVFQAFLDEANRHVTTARKRNVLICDNASWHKCKSNVWGKFEPLFLPPYSPDFNPIEKLWLLIKMEWFSDFIAKDRDALIARLDLALNWAMNRPAKSEKIPSIGR
jgi:transposase